MVNLLINSWEKTLTGLFFPTINTIVFSNKALIFTRINLEEIYNFRKIHESAKADLLEKNSSQKHLEIS